MMLAQAARRRTQRDACRRLSHAANQLYLPWLCPAVWRGNATVTPAAQIAESRASQARSRSVTRSQSRSLATTAEAISQIKASPAFDSLAQDPLPRSRHNRDLTALPQWKPSEPLILHNARATPSPRLPYSNGIGGDPAELYSNFHACLRVGRLDRAAALVRRLRELYNPTAPELLEANNLYVLHLMDRVIQGQPGYTTNTMSSWIEVEMRENDITPDAVTFTCMLRACVATENDSRRERLVRRYIFLAEQAGLLDEVLASAGFTDAEFAVIAQVRPDLIDGAVPEQPSEPTESATGKPLASRHVGEVSAAPEADGIAEIRPVAQKGAGLKTVKEALSIFTDKEELERNLPFPHDLQGYTDAEKQMMWARMRQDRLEEDTIDAAVNRWREEHQNMQKMGITSALQTKPMEALMWQWYTAMVPLFQQELESIAEAYDAETENSTDERLVTGPFVEAFTPEKLAATSLIVAVSQFGSPEHYNGIKVSQIALGIGRQLAVEHSLMVAQGLQSSHSLYRKTSARRLSALIKYSKTIDPEQKKPSQNTKEEEDMETQYESLRELEWAPMIKAKVGALCLSKILEAAKVPVTREDKETRKQHSFNEPAFYHTTVYQAGRKVGMVRLHQTVLEKLRREPLRGSFGTKYPMVVEPLPWTGYRKGGYVRYPETIVRDKKNDDSQKTYAMAAIRKGDMDQVLAGLTVLGKTAWRINKDVFKVVVEAWNTGEPIGDIAPENPRMEYPPEPSEDATKREVAEWMREKQRIDNEKSGYHSQRCFQNFQLEVARAFKDEVFYFPHNMDFRGRAYPIPPLLNHLGADLARGLLTFAKGKELGTVGLNWLKIHLANVYGYDKASLKDREEFAMEHLNDIYDSCANPLTGRRWWLQAEDPWQCLATCYELRNALDSPDPTRYVSHLPVHQDGTCNGLQHYAALGGDRAGAAQVNLEPGDRPSDIYSAVAEIVKADVAKDAKDGQKYARVLDGKISRKVVKQTVMTNVYGVTFTGARLQVIRQLEAILTDEEQKIGLFGMGGYVAKLIFKALGQMFNGAQEIQDWLGTCANRISTSLWPEQIDMIEAQATRNATDDDFLDPKFRRKKTQSKTAKRSARGLTRNTITSQFRATVIWTTPLKMPVVQPYRQTKAKEISTVLQYLSIVQPKATDAIDKRKQLQAFPPNFIHSLDATHMLLSALKCDEIGLTFASVHDSFWTHAADIPVMNRVLRDAFVRMHSEDIVGRLHEEFHVRYKGCMYLATASACSPLGKQIIEWRSQQAKTRTAANARGRRSSKAASKKLKTEDKMQDKTEDKVPTTGHALMDELLAERRRQQLLQSEDEAEREEGRKMMTPGALYDAAKGEDAAAAADLVLNSDEVPVARLGDTTVPLQPKRPSAAKSTENEDSVVVDSDAGMLEEGAIREDADAATAEGDGEGGEEAAAPKKAKKTPSSKDKVQFWLPLDFPPVPKKGDFDVQILRESTYFFS